MHDRTVELLHSQALVLLEDAREYEIECQSRPAGERSSLESLSFQAERLRITTRLLEAMAWILVQKGLAAGQITREEAGTAEFLPGNALICFGGGETQSRVIPPPLRSLLDRSLAFYLEVVRTALEEPAFI